VSLSSSMSSVFAMKISVVEFIKYIYKSMICRILNRPDSPEIFNATSAVSFIEENMSFAFPLTNNCAQVMASCVSAVQIFLNIHTINCGYFFKRNAYS